jgi:hypothetical protein
VSGAGPGPVYARVGWRGVSRRPRARLEWALVAPGGARDGAAVGAGWVGLGADPRDPSSVAHSLANRVGTGPIPPQWPGRTSTDWSAAGEE